MGGMAGFGEVPVDEDQSGHEGWEARLQCVALLSGGMSRGGIEAIPPAEYLSSGYAERWLLCAEHRLVGKRILDGEDLSRWQRTLTDDPSSELPRTDDPAALAVVRDAVLTTPPMGAVAASRFVPGDYVRVARMRPEHHHRCPRYVRGAVGTVERVVGSDPVPGRPTSAGDAEPVYTVSFASTALWGEQAGSDESPFEVMIDLWESYLEAP